MYKQLLRKVANIFRNRLNKALKSCLFWLKNRRQAGSASGCQENMTTDGIRKFGQKNFLMGVFWRKKLFMDNICLIQRNSEN